MVNLYYDLTEEEYLKMILLFHLNYTKISNLSSINLRQQKLGIDYDIFIIFVEIVLHVLRFIYMCAYIYIIILLKKNLTHIHSFQHAHTDIQTHRCANDDDFLRVS